MEIKGFFRNKKNETVETKEEVVLPQVDVKKRRKEPNRTRDKVLKLRLSEEELTLISRLAKEAKQSRTDYILQCIQSTPHICLDGVDELRRELKRQGTNLNQMAKVANERRQIVEKERLKAALAFNREVQRTIVNFLKKWDERLDREVKK